MDLFFGLRFLAYPKNGFRVRCRVYHARTLRSKNPCDVRVALSVYSGKKKKIMNEACRAHHVRQPHKKTGAPLSCPCVFKYFSPLIIYYAYMHIIRCRLSEDQATVERSFFGGIILQRFRATGASQVIDKHRRHGGAFFVTTRRQRKHVEVRFGVRV